MSLLDRNSQGSLLALLSPVTWAIVFLAITICTGCESKIAQRKLEPPADAEIKSESKSQTDPIAAGISNASPTQALDQTLDQTASQPVKQVVDQAVQQPPQTDPKKPAVTQRNGKTYQPNKLNKINTLFLLADQTDIRSKNLASVIREIATPEQQLAAEKLAATFDQQFAELRRRRSEILETAVDGADVESQLLELRMDTADLAALVRTKIKQKILSREQRKELMRLFIEQQENNK